MILIENKVEVQEHGDDVEMKRKKDLYDYNLLHNFDFYKDLNAYILTN